PHSVLSLPPLRPPPSSTLFPYTTLFRSVGWITWLVWIAGIERYLTLLGRALLASPFRRAALRAKGAAAEHADVLRAYRSLRARQDRKSTRLNSSHEWISYAVFCLKKKQS